VPQHGACIADKKQLMGQVAILNANYSRPWNFRRIATLKTAVEGIVAGERHMAKKSILGIAQDQIAEAAKVGVRAVVDSAADVLTKTGAAAGNALSRTTKKVADVKLRSKKPRKALKKPRRKKAKKIHALRRSSKKRK
jgi:hypothetical protein